VDDSSQTTEDNRMGQWRQLSGPAALVQRLRITQVVGVSAAGCDGTAGTIPVGQVFLTWSSGGQGDSYDRPTMCVNQAIPPDYPAAVVPERRCTPAVLPGLILLGTQLPLKGQRPLTY
jgi:hypothetical protein